MMVALLAVFVLATVEMVTSQEDPGSHNGTTENIENVFKGRCWDYDVTRYNNLLPRVNTDCNELWQTFFEAFSYRAPCAVAQSHYQPFLEAAKQSLPINKVMFWSGLYSVAHKFSENGVRFITLEDTMPGYLLNSLRWCGQESPPGMNYSRCPTWFDCPSEASESFWAAASTMFASQAIGNVTVMVDGSNPNKPAYRRDSFFGKYELPSLDLTVVESVDVIVVHALDQPKVEVCGKGSLDLLGDDVTARGLLYSCIDDPEDSTPPYSFSPSSTCVCNVSFRKPVNSGHSCTTCSAVMSANPQ